MSNLITYDELCELIEYDEESGLIRRKRKTRGGCKDGWFVGTISRRTDGYRSLVVSLKNRHYIVSNIIWLLKTGKWPEHEIDHRDRDSLNNRWNNLREATHTQNSFNRNANRNNELGIKGVSFHSRSNKYEASIRMFGEPVYLGIYNTVEEASWAYESVAKVYHEDFYHGATEQ